ncbi:class C sortase [Ruminococcus flavefaciens]|uniref:Sortase A n=1 Tax=Ruminococcus flavefaciens TaxID=1265 RepID=A0A1M7M6B0_RUMFL|nr:class C sortase [Ruminococcus flavefaciens]SHM86251.1 sortase A [Ruminococcus flavefaciens]
MKKSKRSLIVNIVLVLSLAVGLCIMIYPTFSNWWNANKQSRAIAVYDRKVSSMDNADKERQLARAREYNAELAKLSAPLSDYKNIKGYEQVLDITGTGIIGYIEIPKINTYLPIYHGTSPEVLNVAVGHLEGSSLPIGGKGSHSVISAHRGLPSAKLFTDIDQLTENDTFRITVLDEVLDYEVDEIATVLPYEMSRLAAVPDKDYVTLMTCTPYGINTHRLLVRAHRIETDAPHTVKVLTDAVPVDEIKVLPFIVIPVLICLILFWILTGRKDKNERNKSIKR